ncbi:FAD-dependent monooxygenase [Sideroxydans lithotrophicus]|uniref:Ubiquinone biosynthesis hydroxylase, UbiH/UbiF/VisC/COQ6 family n=1 Tax=Sideroxydans lithotrophicus (strain ES-1) TaxID=580332 RepID=D5CTI5_SIDLE|nr:FAD-dependent monooxygenase [Sideroxydans lithotrophicus]ADE10291.1 Ubiquinone biosynthesis hydroxylase, UbiH/UbiF/VisC/COQ6 family [Sideroxydans lithotrophicus ES-1]
MNKTRCDVAIIGGGPVGAALAIALQGNDLNVVLLEARESEINTTDPRALALSYGTRLLLQRLGAWDKIRNVSGIKTIEVTQKHSQGHTVMRAEEMGVPEMGYVLPYTTLHAALQQALHQTDITCLYGAAVSYLRSSNEEATLIYQYRGETHTLNARLAVVAEGGKLLEASHPPQVQDYGQSGIIAHVTSSQPATGKAYEHFTVQGPMALLPYLDGYELVLTASHEMAQEMLAWDDATFLRNLQGHFGDRVGTFTGIGKRSCYPLRLRRAPDITFPHTVLIGNAAQTLHPVAGQGFNMGIRDAWELAQAILDSAPDNIGSAAMCAAYRKSRRIDRNAGIRFTDGLVRLFSNDLPLLGHLRSAALTLLDCIPPAKKFVAKRMMFGANG